MCIAIPSKIISINNNIATVDVDGARRDVSLLLLPEEASEGDYVLVHAGFAIKKISKGIAQESLGILKQVFGEETEE